MTRLVLTSATYFKARLAVPIDKGRTRPRRFRRSSDSSVNVPFMSYHDLPKVHFAVLNGLKLVELL